MLIILSNEFEMKLQNANKYRNLKPAQFTKSMTFVIISYCRKRTSSIFDLIFIPLSKSSPFLLEVTISPKIIKKIKRKN